MTAYLTLERYPISGEQDGFSITVTATDAQAAADDAARNQSIVAVQAGEQPGPLDPAPDVGTLGPG